MRYLPLCLLLFFACRTVKPPQETPNAENVAAVDTTATASTQEKKKEKFKDYEEVVTDDAVTDEGVFTVHRVGDDYYFEVPFPTLGKDMLLV
ncbi:MAG: DUF5118 domain-containing protein, partial [Lewinella sp.]